MLSQCGVLYAGNCANPISGPSPQVTSFLGCKMILIRLMTFIGVCVKAGIQRVFENQLLGYLAIQGVVACTRSMAK